MTVKEIKDFIMHQHLDMDSDDVTEYLPFLMTYVNEGYDKCLKAWAHARIGDPDFPMLVTDSDVPQIPERYHKALGKQTKYTTITDTSMGGGNTHYTYAVKADQGYGSWQSKVKK